MSAFQPEDNVAVETHVQKIISGSYGHFCRATGRASPVVSRAGVLAFATVGRALPFLFGLAVDHGIRRSDGDVIWKIAVAYFIIECSCAFLAFAQGQFIQRFGNQVLFEIRETLIQHVQRRCR